MIPWSYHTELITVPRSISWRAGNTHSSKVILDVGCLSWDVESHHRTIEYPEYEGTHRHCGVQLLPNHGSADAQGDAKVTCRSTRNKLAELWEDFPTNMNSCVEEFTHLQHRAGAAVVWGYILRSNRGDNTSVGLFSIWWIWWIVFHLQMQIPVGNWCNMEGFAVTVQHLKACEIFWVSSKILSVGKISKSESWGEGGESYGQNLWVLDVCFPEKGIESVESMWTPTRFSDTALGCEILQNRIACTSACRSVRRGHTIPPGV